MRKMLLPLVVIALVALSGCLGTAPDKKDNKVTVINQLKINDNKVLAGASTFAEMDFINLGTKGTRDLFVEVSDACLMEVTSVSCNHPNAIPSPANAPRGCYWPQLERLDGAKINWLLTAPELPESATLSLCKDIQFRVNFTYSSRYSVDIVGIKSSEPNAGTETVAQLNAQSDFAPVKPQVTIGAKHPVTVGVPFSIVIKLENLQPPTEGRVVNNKLSKFSFRVRFDPRINVTDRCGDFLAPPNIPEGFIGPLLQEDQPRDYWIPAQDLVFREGKATLPLTCRINITSIDVPRDTYPINFEIVDLNYEYTRSLPLSIVPQPKQ